MGYYKDKAITLEHSQSNRGLKDSKYFQLQHEQKYKTYEGKVKHWLVEYRESNLLSNAEVFMIKKYFAPLVPLSPNRVAEIIKLDRLRARQEKQVLL